MAQRIDSLAGRVDALAKSSADGAAALAGLQQLQQELTQLKQTLKQDEGRRRGYEEMRSRLEHLEQQLGDTQLRVSALLFRYAPPVASAGEPTGFTISSDDDSYRLRIRALLQMAYLAELFTQDATFDGSNLGVDESTFRLSRARLMFEGHVFDSRLRYYVALNYGAIGRDGLLDMYGEYRWHRMFGIRVGLMRPQFGRQFTTRVDRVLLADRSPVSRNFYMGRDFGVMVSGGLLPESRFGQATYQLGVYNGAGAKPLVDNNTDFLYVARLVYEPFGKMPNGEGDREVSLRPKLAIGGSFFYNVVPTDAAERAGETDPVEIATLRDRDGDGDVDDVEVYTAAGELAANYLGFSLQGELFYRKENPGFGAATRGFWGAYGLLGFYHPWGAEIAVRYGFWEQHRYGADRTVAAPARVHEVAGGIDLWFWSDHVKLVAEYAHRWLREVMSVGMEDGGDLRSHNLQILTQLAF